MFEKTIQYDHGDYRMELDGRLIGYARTYHEAEVTLDQVVREMLTHGDCATATELDSGDVEAAWNETIPGTDIHMASWSTAPVARCATCGGDGDCPDCEPVRLDASWSTAPVASADDDTRQNQPLGWCYVCGGASWHPVRAGFLCTSHLSADDPSTDAPGHDEDGVPHALLIDIARTLDMTLGRTRGNASIVHELRRVRADVQRVLGTHAV